MPKAIASLKLSGINRDLPPDAVPADQWTAGSNVYFRDGVAHRSDGQQSMLGLESTAPLCKPQWVAQIPAPQLGGASPPASWLYAGNNIANTDCLLVYSDGTPPDTDISAAAWTNPLTDPQPFTGGMFNGYMIVNNPQNEPVSWVPGAAVSVVLAAWPAAGDRVKSLRPYRAYLIGMNWNLGGAPFPDRVGWSNAAVAGALPTTFTAAAGNDAGSVFLADGRGPVVDGAQLGQDFIIYKQHSTYVMTYVGGNAVMAFRSLLPNSGILTRNCIAVVNDVHVVLTDSDVMAVNARGAESIIDGSNRRWLFSTMNEVDTLKSCVVYNQLDEEIWVCFSGAGTGVLDTALVYDMTSKRWGRRDLPSISYAGSGQRYVSGAASLVGYPRQVLMAYAGDGATLGTGRVYYNDGNASGTYNTLTASLTREDHDLGRPDIVKLVTAVRPRVTATAGTVLKVKAGGRNSPTEAITYSTEVDFTAGTDDTVQLFATGRLLTFALRSTAAAPWKLHQLDVEWQERGRW